MSRRRDFDDYEYDTPRRPERPSHGDMFKQEFGLGNWTGKQAAVLVGVVLLAAGLFLWKFGSDPGTISDRVKDRLGLPSDPVAGRVVSVTGPTTLKLRYLDRNEVRSGDAQLVGLRAPGSCYASQGRRAARQQLPDRARTQVLFHAKLGRQRDGRLQVTLRRGGRDINAALLRAGAARLDAGSARKAGRLGALRRAERSARAAGRGLWRACR